MEDTGVPSARPDAEALGKRRGEIVGHRLRVRQPYRDTREARGFVQGEIRRIFGEDGNVERGRWFEPGVNARGHRVARLHARAFRRGATVDQDLVTGNGLVQLAP